MGIQLDWEVESDIGHEAVQEDAAVVASRQRRQTWNRRALIVLGVLLTLIAAAGVWRYRVVRQAMREALQATVESEALALRLGDQHKFMQFQGPSEEWRQKQRTVFSQFERAGAAIDVTGEILDLHLAGSEARVAVEVMVDNAPQQAVWLYEYTSEKGWKHVATEAEPWSMADHEYEWFTLTHYASDSDVADTVNRLYGSWWARAIDAIHYPGAPPRITIVLDPDMKAGWEEDDYTRLYLPIQRNGDAAPVSAAMLKRFAAEYWTVAAYGHELRQGNRWLEEVTQLYFQHLFDPGEPPSVFFDTLTAAYGSNLLPRYFAMMRDGSPAPVETLRGAIEMTAPTNLEGEALLAHLTAALRAEAFADQLSGPGSRVELSVRTRLFMDEYYSDDSYELMAITIGGTAPDAIEVRSVEVKDNLLWARVRYGLLRGQEPPGATPQMLETYVPFRRIDGRWVHTWLRQGEDSGLFVEQGEGVDALVTLIFDGINAPLVSGMQPELEALYRQAAADFGIQEPAPVTVAISLDGNAISQENLGADYIYVPSVYGQCCLPADISAKEMTRRMIVDQMIFRTYGSRVDATYIYSVFDWVLMNREAERLGKGSMSWMQPVLSEDVQAVEGIGLPTTIAEVVYSASLDQYDDVTRYRTAATLLGGQVLIDLIVDRYGEGGVVALLDRLAMSGTLDAWFKDALGVTATDLEADWRVRYDAALRERFGTGLASQ